MASVYRVPMLFHRGQYSREKAVTRLGENGGKLGGKGEERRRERHTMSWYCDSAWSDLLSNVVPRSRVTYTSYCATVDLVSQSS